MLCLIAGAKTAVFAASAFTLAWTHSVEKTRWEEDWLVTPAGLAIVEARVRGSGSGMEMPDDATLVDGFWLYKPRLPVRDRLVLAQSGATGSGWELCTGNDCLRFGAAAGDPAILKPCEAGEPQPRDQ